MDESKLPHTFPWRVGNTINFLIDGQQFFPAMLGAIEKAEKYILMEMYLFESSQIGDKFVKALMNAAQRGVSVQLLLDAYGSKDLLLKDRVLLINAGVQLAIYNPLIFKKLKRNLFRTHRKSLIVDGKKAFVGGLGINDHFCGDNAWRETVVEIQGNVIKDWHALFKDNFKQWSKNSIPEYIESQKIKDGARARLSYTSAGERLEIKRVLLNRMNNCQNAIWFASAYFIPSRKIRKALRKSAMKGRDVRLLLPGPITDHPSVRYASRRYYARLLRFGVRIFEYQGRFTHTKMVLIDDWFTIGSSNVDRWNFRWNLEANLEVDDATSVKQASEILQNDFENCHEIHYKNWVSRSRMQRIKEWLWGKMDIWLTKHIS